MRTRDRDTVLEIVDLVLGDLRLRDRMFFGRRPEPEHPDLIVIQTGEDGRHPLPVPASESRGRSRCSSSRRKRTSERSTGSRSRSALEHDHALVPRVERGGVWWVCPDGGWSCALGAYEETTWPPPLDAGYLAGALAARLDRRGVAGVRRIGCVERDGRWVAQVGIWPMDPSTIDAVTRVAAPVPVVIEPCQDVFRRVADTPSGKLRPVRR